MTDIHRSKAFCRRLLGMEPGRDFSDQVDDPTVRHDPWRTDGGCSSTFHGQPLGLRPVAPSGLVVLSLQDPDGIDLELAAPRA